MRLQLLPILTATLLLGGTLRAQTGLFIDQSYVPETMIIDFFNQNGILVSNIDFSGNPTAVAFFDAGNTSLDVPAGMLLTTGNAAEVPQPATQFASTNNSPFTTGDPDIDATNSDGQSFDATVIEFDFVSTFSDTFDFKYVFASEEYPEFTCSPFNDQFMFLVSGPGLPVVDSLPSGGFNTSLVPGQNIPVSINNVHGGNNPNGTCPPVNEQFYLDTPNDADIVYDGRTVCLPAKFYVIAGETYHAKIVIADVGDHVFDSGVFIGVNSLAGDSLLVPPADFLVMVDDTNGMVSFENNSRYATDYLWDFGNGQTSTDRHPEPVFYDDPGDYTVTLVTENYCCSDTTTQSFSIMAPLSLTVDLSGENLCFDDENVSAILTTTGGTTPYTFTYDPMDLNLDALGSGMYNITVTDADGSSVNTTFFVEAPNPMITVVTAEPEVNSDMNGSATVEAVTAGAGDYTYLWSNGATTPNIEFLSCGQYTVTITDGNGCELVETTEVECTTDLADVDDPRYRVSISPNPNNGQFNLELNGTIAVERVQIFDAFGKYLDDVASRGTIDLRDRGTGMFQVRVVFTDGKETWQRVVVR